MSSCSLPAPLLLLLVASALVCSACGNDTGNTGNTGNLLPTDTATVADSGAATDTGTTAADSGATAADSGATAADTGTASPDVAGTDSATSADVGSGTDAATGADAGVVADAGPSDVGASDGSGSGKMCAGTDCKYQSGASCQCDSYCESAGDCCPDYVEQCKKADCKTDTDCDDKNACTTEVCENGKNCKYTSVADGGACDDGKPCTEKDGCKGGACKGTNKADGATCDDGEFCTEKDGCKAGVCKGSDKKKDTPCDDGKVCTEGDKCSTYGSCFGSAKDCNDDKPCTTDSCDAKTGKCGHEVKKDGAYCSDGNSCTEKDACKAGVCEATDKKDDSYCSDGNSCTTDKCVGGKCAGTPDSSKDSKACSDDDPCTASTTCSAGKCSGPQDACDDGNPCTMDSCTKKTTYTKECKNEAMKDGSSCDDGDPCTEGDACTAKKCTSKPSTKCSDALSDSFPCGSKGSWTLSPTADDAKSIVGWAVDSTPSGPVAPSPKCSLNFNNGTNFNAKDNTGKLVASTGTAVSAEIDLSKAAGAKMSYQSYMDTETSSLGDWMYVEVSVDDFKTTAKSWKLDKPSSGMKKWVLRSHDLSPWAGKKIKMRFRFDSNDDIANTGAGWFVDDLNVQVLPK